MPDPLPLQPGQVAEIGRLYRSTDLPVRVIAARFGLPASRFYRLRRRERWPLRRPPRARPRSGRRRSDPESAVTAPGAAPPRPAGLPRHLDGPALVRRVQRLLAAKIVALEREARSGRPDADPERSARSLASMTRTLKQLSEIAASSPILSKDNDGTDPPARSLDELRAELCRHMLRLRDEARAAKRPRGLERGRA